MTTQIGPELEWCRVSVVERMHFLRIVQLETYRGPRALIDQWAAPNDTNPHADQALTLTLAAMWRETERQEESNG